MAKQSAPKSNDAFLREVFADSIDKMLELKPVLAAVQSSSKAVDPEVIHDFRVALRTLRSNLRSLSRFFDKPKALKPVLDDLGWLDNLIGQARDADVLINTLNAATSRITSAATPNTTAITPKDLADLGRLLIDNRDSARVKMVVGLGSKRANQILGETQAFIATAQFKPNLTKHLPVELKKQAKATFDKFAATTKKLDFETAKKRQIHALRIEAKRARYLLEAVGPVLKKAPEKQLAALTAAQTLLGDFNDLVVAEAWVSAQAKRNNLPPQTAKALRSALRTKQRELRRQLVAQL